MTISLKALAGEHATVYEVADAFQFPGGELHLRDIERYDGDSVQLIADIRGAEPEDLITAALYADVARQYNWPLVVMLPYLPAARADRGVPLGVSVYANLVNGMEPDQVICVDPHSEVAETYYDEMLTLDAIPLLQRAIMNTKYDAVIAPDKGAVERAMRAAKALGVDLYRAEKIRDFDTGRILDIAMTEKLPPSGKYLVVDDICDGGGTFAGLAAATGLGRNHLGIWITHGVFSGKASDLHANYEWIYTTDSHPGAYRGSVRPYSTVPVYGYMFHHMKDFR